MTKDAAIREEAARWLIELDDATAKERAECVKWLRESPLHVREFLLAGSLWKGLDDVDSQRQVDVERLLAEASAKVVTLPSELATPCPAARRPLTYRWIAGVAAVLALVTVAAWWHVAHAPIYSTAIGEQRAIKLPDGSLINLNTHSKIAVKVDAAAREVTLDRGEALFTVVRDPQCPFRVHVGDTTIQVLGTQFNVYRRDAVTTVSVIEGAVQVDKTRLGAGEQLQIAARGAVEKPVAADVTKAIAWRERRLVFRGDTLEDVAAEVNRYNEALQIRVDGAARNRRLIGVFAADDPESLIQFLSHDGSLGVERKPGEILIHTVTP